MRLFAMIKDMVLLVSPLRKFLREHKRIIILLIAAFFVAIVCVIVGSYCTISPYRKYVVTAEQAKHTEIGIVLGAGVANNGQPYDELKARLDKAADALNSGLVSKLLLSGDNRFKNYDEPTAMFNYLVNKRGVSAQKLERDYAGRSTYESCERATKVFGIKQTIIFSAESHLPRAIYLCRHFGIDAYGISSGLEASNSSRRELLARVKAVYNVNLFGERTVL